LNPYLQSVILGIVEGLTEFLPVSSTAHLRITEALMKIPLDDAYWKMYTIVIQLGAIAALVLLFLGRIAGFMRTFPKGEDGKHTWLTHPISLTLIAFAVTSVPSLLIGGIVMWVIDAWADRREANTEDVDDMSLGQAIWIGLCQTLSAVFPGTSRSMSTIASGQLASLTRPAALEFSFLLSIPTMIAATGWDFVKEVYLHKAVGADGVPVGHVVMSSERWIVLAIGMVVSFIVALGVVEWFLQWVRKHGFALFALYRILLGGALLIWGSHLIG